jgi:hypothetical protein
MHQRKKSATIPIMDSADFQRTQMQGITFCRNNQLVPFRIEGILQALRGVTFPALGSRCASGIW